MTLKLESGQVVELDEVVNALLDTLADKVAERLQSPRKELWSADELAERYGVTGNTIRQKMRAGEFGALVQVGERRHLVPWSGVQAYEAAHRSSFERTKPKQGTRHTYRADPGPI